MSRISEKFKGLRENNKKALIAYITAGDPTLPLTEKLVYALLKSGADIIELGIPFSDPLADGPIIQASHQRALKKNVSLADVFALVKKIRNKTEIPLIFMLSYNLMFRYGTQKFFKDAQEFGLDGVIVPDLPPDEWTPVKRSAVPIDMIFLAAPTSTSERLELISDASKGFIYLVSLTGITGKRATVSNAAFSLVEKMRKITDKPLAVGFGISGPKQAKAVVQYADGVIVGSAIVDIIARNPKAPAPKVGKFVASLRRAIDSVK
ncbi:MAG: tryptophan synthase subunit alpha [Candidatus Saganbacteria bacterium]|nr:tryptophan synthase subunit alpha [Candidatus Saganbacteria bacterium]